MNTDKLISDILSAQDSGILNAEVLRSLLLQNRGTRCNNCVEFYEPSRSTTEVRIVWGYYSLGKDGDVDTWNLCQTCTEQFEDKWELHCASCQQSLARAAAELGARNPHSIFYGDLDAALKHQREHRITEYAKILDRVFCEICYEQILLSMKHPPITSNGFFAGDALAELLTGEAKEPEKRPQSRIQAALAWRYTESHEAFLPYEEALAVRKENNIFQAIAVSSRRDQDKLWMKMGTGQTFYLPVKVLSDRGISAEDLTRMKLADHGKTMRFEQKQILVADLIPHLQCID